MQLRNSLLEPTPQSIELCLSSYPLPPGNALLTFCPYSKGWPFFHRVFFAPFSWNPSWTVLLTTYQRVRVLNRPSGSSPLYARFLNLCAHLNSFLNTLFHRDDDPTECRFSGFPLFFLNPVFRPTVYIFVPLFLRASLSIRFVDL